MAWNFNSTPKLVSVGNFGLSDFIWKYVVHELLFPAIAWDAVHLVMCKKPPPKQKYKEKGRCLAKKSLCYGMNSKLSIHKQMESSYLQLPNKSKRWEWSNAAKHTGNRSWVLLRSGIKSVRDLLSCQRESVCFGTCLDDFIWFHFVVLWWSPTNLLGSGKTALKHHIQVFSSFATNTFSKS